MFRRNEQSKIGFNTYFKKGGRSLLCFPLEFLRTLLANLVHTNDNDAAPLNVRTDAAP